MWPAASPAIGNARGSARDSNCQVTLGAWTRTRRAWLLLAQDTQNRKATVHDKFVMIKNGIGT